MHNRIKIIVLIIFLTGTSLTSHSVLAFQEESKLGPDFYFTCVQNENEFILKTRLSYWNGDRDVFIDGAKVVFYNMAGEEARQLEAVSTDMNGEAVFQIEKSSDQLTSL
jgi:hypothetical protein